jgi:hypothetical protein
MAGAATVFLFATSAVGGSAQAEELHVGGCIGGWTTFNCVSRWGEAGDPYVREVPQPSSDADKARAKERDKRWVDRCRPYITQDRYGVARYHYAEPGCEFGIGD